MSKEDTQSLAFYHEEVKPLLDRGLSVTDISKELDLKVEEVERYAKPYCHRSGPKLFREVMAWFHSMFHFDEPKDAALVTLMMFQTRVYPILPCVFYIFVMGRPGSGKSILLNAMSMLGRGIMLGNISTAAMARELGRRRAVREGVELVREFDSTAYHLACFDEYDSPGDKDRHFAMDELLRHGYTREGPPYIRWDMKGNKSDRFDMYMPKAAAVTSSVDPALSSRGFKVSAAPYEGPNGFEILINNRYPKDVPNLRQRLDAWGEDALAHFDAERVEALERSPEHGERVRLAVGALGANRETQLALTVTTIAAMASVELIEELKHGVETLFTAGEEYEEEIEELNTALMKEVEALSPIEAAATVTVKQSAVKKTINEERERNHRKPLGDKRFAAIYRAAGIRTSWVRNRSGRNYWVIPMNHLQILRGLVNSPNMVNIDGHLDQSMSEVDQVDRVRRLHEDADRRIPYETLIERYGKDLVERERIPRFGGGP